MKKKPTKPTKQPTQKYLPFDFNIYIWNTLG